MKHTSSAVRVIEVMTYTWVLTTAWSHVIWLVTTLYNNIMLCILSMCIYSKVKLSSCDNMEFTDLIIVTRRKIINLYYTFLLQCIFNMFFLKINRIFCRCVIFKHLVGKQFAKYSTTNSVIGKLFFFLLFLRKNIDSTGKRFYI